MHVTAQDVASLLYRNKTDMRYGISDTIWILKGIARFVKRADIFALFVCDDGTSPLVSDIVTDKRRMLTVYGGKGGGKSKAISPVNRGTRYPTGEIV